MIRLAEALDAMKRRDHLGLPVAFIVRFVTCDRARKRGGEVVEMAATHGKRGRTARPRRAYDAPPPASSAAALAASGNSTVNITGVESGQTRRVHIRLITQFNHEPVIW